MSELPQYGRHLHPNAKMRAVVIDRYGGPEVLRLASVPRPVPTRGQALVRTRFIGVNPKDVIVRKGRFKVATGKKFPLIVGHDIAGQVVEAGLGCDFNEGELAAVGRPMQVGVPAQGPCSDKLVNSHSTFLTILFTTFRRLGMADRTQLSEAFVRA